MVLSMDKTTVCRTILRFAARFLFLLPLAGALGVATGLGRGGQIFWPRIVCALEPQAFRSIEQTAERFVMPVMAAWQCRICLRQ